MPMSDENFKLDENDPKLRKKLRTARFLTYILPAILIGLIAAGVLILIIVLANFN